MKCPYCASGDTEVGKKDSYCYNCQSTFNIQSSLRNGTNIGYSSRNIQKNINLKRHGLFDDESPSSRNINPIGGTQVSAVYSPPSSMIPKHKELHNRVNNSIKNNINCLVCSSKNLIINKKSNYYICINCTYSWENNTD